MKLNIAKPGNNVRVVTVKSGHGLQKRLTDLGITPGSELKIIENHTSGPVIVSVKGSKLMLGCEMSKKILVI